jgi:predicted amidophosphoribosyltransferase
VLGPLAAICFRRETEEALRICPGCRSAVRHYDSMCMRCGSDLSYPDEQELIEPHSAMRVRARL